MGRKRGRRRKYSRGIRMERSRISRRLSGCLMSEFCLYISMFCFALLLLESAITLSNLLRLTPCSFIAWRVALMELALSSLDIASATTPITSDDIDDPYK